MEKKKADLIYSEPVREIMGSPPRLFIRYGTLIISSLFFLLLIFSALFRYPDLVRAQVEITTENPPLPLVSKGTFRIRHLFVKNGEKVEKGKLLGVMETVASPEEIRILRKLTDSCKTITEIDAAKIPQLSSLGEVQSFYSSLRKSIADLNSFEKNDFYGIRIRTVKEELNGLRKYRDQLTQKERLLTENFELERKTFRRDSALKRQETIAQADYEKSKKALNSQEIQLKDAQMELSSKNIDIGDRIRQVNELTSTRDSERSRLLSAGDEALNNLRAQIAIWENTYLLQAPETGIAAFTKYWSENQTVGKDESVISLIPENPGQLIGRIYLGMDRSGKVEKGQDVNIKLSGFPYLEFGMLRGKVISKSLVSSGDAYVIVIGFRSGFRTVYGKDLEFTQNMQGTAEIITSNRSLLAKIVSPLRYIITRNRN